MKIFRSDYELGKTYHHEEDIDFSSAELNHNFIRKIKDCHVEVDVDNLSTILRVRINLISNVILPCSYTLEDVDYVIKGNEEFDFVEDESIAVNESLFFEKETIDLDPYIYSLLIALVPQKVIKKGASLPKGGKGYRVLSEDEYLKEKEKQLDPRWSKLDEIDFDE